jgi:hypothetical protein
MGNAKKNHDKLSPEEWQDLTEECAAGPSDEHGDEILRRAGVAPEPQGPRITRRQWWEYHHQVAAAAKTLMEKLHLALPEDDETRIDLMEAALAGDNEQVVTYEEKLKDPARLVELIERRLAELRIPVPADKHGNAWGVAPPKADDDERW